jgi:hypothetical protein
MKTDVQIASRRKRTGLLVFAFFGVSSYRTRPGQADHDGPTKWGPSR